MPHHPITDEQQKLAEAAHGAGPLASLDLAIVEAAEPWSRYPVVRAIGDAAQLADQPPLVAASALTLAAGLASGRPRLARTGARMLAAHGLATLFKALIKDRIDRTRPRRVARDGHHEAKPGHSKAKDKRSFPSGHSAGAVAVARAIARDNPGAAAVAYPLAAAASLVQVPRQAHFPSDVVIGAALGVLAEALVSRAFRGLNRAALRPG